MWRGCGVEGIGGKRDQATMIHLTRLNSHAIIINADLIKFIENAPDTLLTLTNGEKIVVLESAEEVISKIVSFRRALLKDLITVASDLSPVVAAANQPAAGAPPDHGREGSSRG
jgi:flagellar protein FlbD